MNYWPGSATIPGLGLRRTLVLKNNYLLLMRHDYAYVGNVIGE